MTITRKPTNASSSATWAPNAVDVDGEDYTIEPGISYVTIRSANTLTMPPHPEPGSRIVIMPEHDATLDSGAFAILKPGGTTTTSLPLTTGSAVWMVFGKNHWFASPAPE